MEAYTALAGVDACIGWLGAFALLIVGLTVVRKASGNAGLMVALAGVLKLFVNCCAWWPTFYAQAEGYDELVTELMSPSITIALFLRFIVYVLLAAAAFVMAKQALQKPAPAGGQPWNG